MSSRRRLTHSLTDAFASEASRDIGAASALFESAVGAAQHFRRIPVDRIRPRADQPRRSMDAQGLDGLTDSIRAHGVLQPIRVRPCAAGAYEIIAGERRWLAAQRAGLRLIPAVVAVADDEQAFVEALIENVQREDLNAVDRAHALQRLRVDLGLQSWEDVGRVVGLSRQHVHNLLRISELPEPMQNDVRSGDLTEKHCRALMRLRDDVPAQARLWQRIHDDKLTGDGALAEAKRVWNARDGASTRVAPDAAPVRPPRIGVVVDALLEALSSATHAELHIAREQLATLHVRLAALLSVDDGMAPASAPVPPGGVPIPADWRPVLIPVAGQHAG